MNSDALILQQALAGQRDAVRELVARLTPVVHSRVARLLVRRGGRGCRAESTRQEVEDLAQEIFLILFDNDAKVLRAWDQSRGLNLKGFVGLVASRQVASILRSGKRSGWAEDPTLQEDLERAVNRAESEDRGGGRVWGSASSMERQLDARDLLRTSLNRLEERLSPLGLQLFDLLCVQERSVTEVCEAMNMKADAVYAWRSRLARLASAICRETQLEGTQPTQNRSIGAQQ